MKQLSKKLVLAATKLAEHESLSDVMDLIDEGNIPRLKSELEDLYPDELKLVINKVLTSNKFDTDQLIEIFHNMYVPAAVTEHIFNDVHTTNDDLIYLSGSVKEEDPTFCKLLAARIEKNPKAMSKMDLSVMMGNVLKLQAIKTSVIKNDIDKTIRLLKYIGNKK